MPFERGIGHVVFNRARQGKPFGLAVLAGESDALRDTDARWLVASTILFDPDPARDDRREPEDRTNQRGPSCTDQAGDTKDLAAPEHQARRPRRLTNAKLVELEYRITGGVRHVGKELVQVAPDHLGDDRLQIGVAQSPPRDRLPIPQDGIRLGDPARFFKKMADINDRQAAGAKPLDDRE